MSNVSGYVCGFVVFVGRPNVGKSTLMNALVGQKVSITSSKVQTTRHTVRGIVNCDNAQLVLVDTPGFHKPRTLLGKRLNSLVLETVSDVDVVGVCLPADEKIGLGDSFIVSKVLGISRKPVVVFVTKIDKVSKEKLLRKLLEVEVFVEKMGVVCEDIVPVSTVDGYQLGVVKSVLSKHLPVSSALYPLDMVTDDSVGVRVAEFVREAALEGVQDELPHSLAVVVEEISKRDGFVGEGGVFWDVRVNIYVERSSQKAIVIGKRGVRLRDVGVVARKQIEVLLGGRIYLDLFVKVAKDWQGDAKQLDKLGF